jgi:hypothetical protein
VFLCRRLYKRRRDGAVMHPCVLELHYPWYWHYDVLGGLVAMRECGKIHDPRCADPLAWLESKRLPDGGWPAENRFYSVTDRPVAGRSRVGWGVTVTTHGNEWVTMHALATLKTAGRLGSKR